MKKQEKETKKTKVKSQAEPTRSQEEVKKETASPVIKVVSRTEAEPGDVVEIVESFINPGKVRYEMLVQYNWLPKGHYFASFSGSRWQLFADHKQEEQGHERRPDELVFTYTPYVLAGTPPPELYIAKKSSPETSKSKKSK